MKQIKSSNHTFLIFLFLLIGSSIKAQPCLPEWSYRTPITLNNSGGILSSVPVKLIMDTQSLISAGKLRFDGGDLRFTDALGNTINYWIDTENFNSLSSTIWIVPSLLNSGNSIFYMFYGNATSSSGSNGVSVFSLYDGFNGTSLDGSKWQICGSGNVNLLNGTVSLVSTSTLGDEMVLRTQSTFSGDQIIEARVIGAVGGGGGFVGIENSANQEGYSLFYKESTLNTMQMKLHSASACISLSDQQPSAETVDAIDVVGDWSLRWKTTGEQFIDWPGSPIHPRTRTDNTYTFPALFKGVVGQTNTGATLEIDWVRVRKITDNTITDTYGVEELILISGEITTSAPICEGEGLYLNVTSFSGATYSWSGPNGFTSSVQNPVIFNAQPAQTGLYQCLVTVVGACSAITITKDITVSATSNKGVISGNAIVCEDSNSGNVLLVSYTGDILFWESSLSGLPPWNTISYVGDNLPYTDLNQTTYYRAMVQNGTCAAIPTDSVKISVSNSSVGGYIVGANPVCSGVNTSELSLQGATGDVVVWQSSIDGFATFSNIITTNTDITITDISQTTGVRAIVQNGICNQDTSVATTLTANPLPIVTFSNINACFGSPTIFSNTSSINTGFITSYSWKFDDGNNSVNTSPAHVFVNDGNFNTRLIAISDKGCIDSLVQNVSIKARPTPSFSFLDNCEDVAVAFSNASNISSGAINVYDWNFGDGNSSPVISPVNTFVNAGEFEVKLKVTSDLGCADSLSQTINIVGRSTLDFTALDVCDKEDVIFVNNSTSSSGSISFTWDFGDGAISNSISPQHLYASSGSYLVSLSSSSGACSDILSKTIIVNPKPIANFSTVPVCLLDSIKFDNASAISTGTLAYSWEFGDGKFSTLGSPSYKYAAPGTYKVKLTILSNLGCKDEKIEFVEIFPQPTAQFVASPICLGEQASFQNLSNTGSETGVFYWNFGDGSSSTDTNPIHNYISEGQYDVQLVVLTSVGCNDTINNSIEVSPLPNTSFTVQSVCDGLPSEFNNTSLISSGSITSYLWDFGDGKNSTSENPVKQYLNAGNYTVELLTETDKGCSNKTTGIAEVLEVPIASFNFNTSCPGFPVTFLNTSIAPPNTSYLWDFGDGNSSTQPSPFHQYQNAGNYQVKLKATTIGNCTDSVIYTVSSFPEPFTTISSDTTIRKGFSVPLKATGGVVYKWSPIDGLDNSESASPIATPITNTNYSVLISDINGCEVTREVTVSIEDDYFILASNVITPNGNGENDTWVVKNILNYPDNEVIVVNKWGQEVFRQREYQNDWSGTSGADILPDGSYYYVILFDSGVKYSGALTILRDKN